MAKMKMIKERLKGSSKRSEKNQAFVSPGLGYRENLEPGVLQNTEWSEVSGMGAVDEVCWVAIHPSIHPSTHFFPPAYPHLGLRGLLEFIPL